MTSMLKNYASKLLDSTIKTMIPTLRYKSGRDCKMQTAPRCSPEELRKTKCMKKFERANPLPEKKKFRGMWENPECCRQPCKTEFPRFDELYYAPSDKENRRYTRTWDECPSLKVKSKRKCFLQDFDLAPIERRPRKPRGGAIECRPLDLMSCTKGLKGYCAKITLPGCKGVKTPHTCVGMKASSGCKKICAPYPSFSECVLPDFRPLPRRECDCVSSIGACDIWNLIRAGKLDYKKKFKHN